MGKIINIPQMGIILDGIYRNYSKPALDQKNIRDLSKECGVNKNMLIAVRNILAARKCLIIEGIKRSQRCYWNPSRSTPNPAMLTDVYREYTKNMKSGVKVEKRESRKRLPSEEAALQALAQRGCVRVILKFVRGNKTTIETYDFSTTEKGEWSPFSFLLIH